MAEDDTNPLPGGSYFLGQAEPGEESSGLSSYVRQGIGGVLLALGAAFASGVVTAAELIIRPIEALQENFEKAADAFFSEPLDLITTAAGTSEAALESGGSADAGVFTIILGLGVVIIFAFILGQFLRQESTGNLIPFVPDIPFLGREEEDEG